MTCGLCLRFDWVYGFPMNTTPRGSFLQLRGSKNGRRYYYFNQNRKKNEVKQSLSFLTPAAGGGCLHARSGRRSRALG